MRSVFCGLLALVLSVAAPSLLGATGSATSTAPSANQVEPLSNGLRLSMTQAEIVHTFGAPTDVTTDPRSFGYADFFVACGGAQKTIWHLTLKGGVKLHNGLGVGSPRQEVQAVFGPNDRSQSGQYRLTFLYGKDGTVAQIKIDPAQGEFADYRAAAAHPPRKPASPLPTAATDGNAAVAGTWWCVAPSWSSGTIELKSDGSYTRSSGTTGHYEINGNTVLFDGDLKTWDHGRAKLESDSLIFEWSNPDGSHHYFAFRHARD